MRCVVIGAGAWGLPTAAELARRGHQVTLVDRHGAFNQLSSSSGPTRLWRLADPDPARVRLARRGLEAMRRLSDRAGHQVFLTRGLLWRDDVSLPALTSTMGQESVRHEVVAARDVAARAAAGVRKPPRRNGGRAGHRESGGSHDRGAQAAVGALLWLALKLKWATPGPTEPSIDLYMDRHQRALSGGVILAQEVP